MRKDKSKALQLRKMGRSYNEIHKLLKIPKSTLSGWFHNLNLPLRAKSRLGKRIKEKSLKGLLKKSKEQTKKAQERMKQTRKLAKSSISKLSQKDLKLIGASLYWAEGYKRPIIRNNKEITSHPVALTNL
ncbi:MAG: hypothetical protein AB1721_01525 [Patescibacteria group bacterium]